MKMPIIAIVSGLALDLLSVITFLISDTKSMSVWIPAFFGLPILIAGMLALNPAMLKGAMHAAAGFSLLGFIAACAPLAGMIAKGSFKWKLSTVSITAMAVICGIFLILCVQSFIAVRRARVASGGA